MQPCVVKRQLSFSLSRVRIQFGAVFVCVCSLPQLLSIWGERAGEAQAAHLAVFIVWHCAVVDATVPLVA